MAFDPISSSEIAVDKPITNELLTKFVNRDNAVNAQVGSISDITILNPSFELDSDADNQPDDWTITYFLGGTGAIDTATSVHGAQSYKFTHPGGGGNGGGYMQSDYRPISTHYGGLLKFSVKPTETNMNVKAIIQHYDDNKSTLAETTLFNATGLATVWARKTYGFVVPSSGRFARIKLVGGGTEATSLGTVNFDDVTLDPITMSSVGNYVIAERHTANAVGSSVMSNVWAAKVGHPGNYRINFNTVGTAVVKIYVNAVEVSSFAHGGGEATYNTSRLDIDDLIQIQTLNGAATAEAASTYITFSVENPAYGKIGINRTASSTVAT